MNNLSSKIVATVIFAFKATFLNAMDAPSNFDEDVDKLLFVAKAQTQYLGNWISLVKENNQETQNFLGNFIFPVGGQKLREQRAILDFYMDYLYSKFIELSLVKLKESKSQETFQNNLFKLYENIRRAHDVTIGDVIKRGSDYFGSITPSLKIEFNTKTNQRSYRCDSDDYMGVFRIQTLVALGKVHESVNNLSDLAALVNLVFEDDSVTIHYFNQALNLEKISDVLSQYLTRAIPKLHFVQEIGTLNFTYDKIYKSVLDDHRFNNSLMNKIGLEESLENGIKLSKNQSRLLSVLRNKYKDINSVEFLAHEEDFIEKEVQAIFQTKKDQIGIAGDDGWGSNPLMDKFRKDQKSQKRRPQKKQPVKSKNSSVPTTSSETVKDVPSNAPSNVPSTVTAQETLIPQTDAADNLGDFFLKLSSNYAADSYPILIKYLDPKSLSSLICTTKSLHQFFIDSNKQIKISEIDYEEEFFDFDCWYKDNVFAYSQPSRAVNHSILESSSRFIKPQFYGLGETFLNVIFGHGYVEVTTKHFNSFLKQAGGYKVKMSQNGYIPICLKDKSVETHYVVPSLLDTRHETPFCLYLVHQPHSASIPFPKKTLYNFLRRDLAKAGYIR